MLIARKRFIWAFVFLICISLALVYSSNSRAVNTSNEEKVSVQILNDEINKGIKIQTETKESELMTTFKMIPFLNSKAIDEPIHKWASEQEKAFIEELEKKEVSGSERIPAHLNFQTDIHKLDDNIYNFVITVEQFIHHEMKNTYVKTYMIDLEKESFISISDIFTDINELITLLTEKTKDDNEIKEEIQNNIHDLNWEIHDDEFNLYFNSNDQELNNEINSLKVPLIELHNYLTEDYKKILISKKIANEIKEVEEQKNNNHRKLDPNGKYIALTFDDGPHATITNQVLNTLKDYDAKATFFMLSKNVEFYPEVAKDVVKAGHEIGNHSITHVNLNAVNKNRMKTEIIESKQLIQEVTGIEPHIFRPPYGEHNQVVLNHAENTNQSVILWSVDSLDWKSKNVKSIYNTTINQIRPGAIVLFHDIHKPTADALPLILKSLIDEGYEFVTVSELIPLLDSKGNGPYYGN